MLFLLRMKLVVVFYFLLEVLLAKEEIYMLGTITYCRECNLKMDEPLEVNLSHKRLVIHQSNGNISSTTLSLLKDREALTIMLSRISYVEDGVLCSSPMMQELVLEYNSEFPVLTESLLSNCENIKILRLHAVQLEPSAFKYMTSLQELQLSGMKIPHFTETYLESLKELKEIGLFTCEIENIDPAILCSPPKLQKLTLGENVQFPPLTKSLFEGCNNVKDLKILHYRTTFVNIDEDTLSDFTGLKRFETNHLIINHLTRKHFGSMILLEQLFLIGCNITDIDTDVFEGLTNLDSLELIGSDLKNEDLHIFANLTNLLKLDLSGNNLDSIDDLKFPKLKYLHVTRNSISKVDVNKVISNLPKLEGLFIYENPMTCSDKKRLTEDIEKPGRFAMTVLDERDLEKEQC